jgi:branched-chain amino acid transport system permease protein
MEERFLSGCVSIGLQIMLAISANIVSGYARQLCLGQAVFAGLGAYTSALLNVRLGVSFWLACPLSVLVTGGMGFLLGLPCLRMPKYYILIMTFGVNFLMQQLLRSGHFAGGYLGIGRISPPQLSDTPLHTLAYLLLVLVISFALFHP